MPVQHLQCQQTVGVMFAADLLARHPYTVKTDALHYVGLHESPAAHISLRAIDPDRFTIVNEVMLCTAQRAVNGHTLACLVTSDCY